MRFPEQVLSPSTDVGRLDRKLLECMVEMAYWRRQGEEVLAPTFVLAVLGLDGRGVGSQVCHNQIERSLVLTLEQND